jgi:hypothetical protein
MFLALEITVRIISKQMFLFTVVLSPGAGRQPLTPAR